MWCRCCTKWGPQLGNKFCTNFVKDCSSYNPPQRKKESVDSHFSSRVHAKCLEKDTLEVQPAEEAEIYKQITALDKNVQEKMIRLVRIVFYFALKDRSANEFTEECQLQKLNGVNLGEKYQNRISFCMLLKYIAKTFKNDIAELVNSSNFLTVMTDSSTTHKTTEYEAVLIKYVPKDENIGKIAFIGLCKIQTADSAGLAKVIAQCLKDAGILDWEEKLVSMSVDGASVNIGKHNGLVNLMNSPFHVHCYNHLLDLCLKDAIKQDANASKIIALIKSICAFYRASPKLTRELFKAGEALHLKIWSFKPICDSRWANSLEASIMSILHNYPAIIQHLSNINSNHVNYTSNVKTSAKVMLQDLLLYNTVFFFHAFADFVVLMSRASLYLERNDINISEATQRVKKLSLDLTDFGALGELKGNDDSYLVKFLSSLDDADENCIKFNDINLVSRSFTTRHQKNASDKKMENNHHHKLCINASNNILKRFFEENGPGNSICVRTASILDTAFFPTNIEDLNDYGETEITEMCSIFKLSKDRAISEWKQLRVTMFRHFKSSISLPSLLEKLRTEQFKNLNVMTEILEILLTISSSTAQVERVWSSAGNIINDKNMSMDKETLENRLIIKQANIQLEHFNAEVPVELWWNDSIRRPNLI